MVENLSNFILTWWIAALADDASGKIFSLRSSGKCLLSNKDDLFPEIWMQVKACDKSKLVPYSSGTDKSLSKIHHFSGSILQIENSVSNTPLLKFGKWFIFNSFWKKISILDKVFGQQAICCKFKLLHSFKIIEVLFSI